MEKIRVTPEELLTIREELLIMHRGVIAAKQGLEDALMRMEASFRFGGSDAVRADRAGLCEAFGDGIASLGKQIEKLAVMAENYRETERMNADEEAADG